MPSFIYPYSYTDDFGENLKEDQLFAEIEADSEFSGIRLKDVGRTGNSVRISFDTALNGSQIIVLDNLVAAHSPVISTTNNISTILTSLIPRTNTFNFTTLTRCATFNYPGTKVLPPISYCTCLAYCSNSVQSYDIRIYNIDSDLEIYFGNFTNHAEEKLILQNLNNIPEDSATIEIQVRMHITGTTNNKFVYVDNITIFA